MEHNGGGLRARARARWEHRADVAPILAQMSEAERGTLLSAMHDTLHDGRIDISESVDDTLDLDVLLPGLLSAMVGALDAERGTLFLYDEETAELYSRVAEGAKVDEIRVRADAGIAGAVFASGRGELVRKPYEDPRFNRAIDRHTGFRTREIVCVPVEFKGRRIGVAQVLNKRNGAFGEETVRALETLVAQVAAPLENARLYGRVEKSRREEAQLLSITNAIASELQLDTLLARVIAATTEMLDAERSSLFMFDQKTGELWSRIAEGLEVKEIRFPVTAGIAGACFSSGEPINITDAYADPRFNQEVDRRTGYRTRSILCMPVMNKAGRTIAVIQVLNKKGGRFTGMDERRLRAFTAQVAMALENAWLFEEVVRERNHNESILRSLSNGVLTLDVEQRILAANQSALRILGWRELDVVGRAVEEMFSSPENTWVLHTLSKTIETGENGVVMDAELRLPSGTVASVNLTTVPLLDAEECPVGSMLVIEDITREKRIKSTMARYMTKELVEKLVRGGEEALGGVVQIASVLFCDIRRFTSISEQLGARDTVSMLNEYFTSMIDVIFKYDGILDKYIGDAMMALFGAPFQSGHDADNALLAANEMLAVLGEFNARRVSAGRVPLEVGIGLNTGEMVAGNIGSPKRMDYTVIGDTVNLAARLESATKVYSVPIIYSEFTANTLTGEVRARELDLIRVRGKRTPVAIYESLIHHDNASFPRMAEVLDAFERGLRRYRARDWSGALSAFERVLALRPEDGPSREYVRRCQHCMRRPPDERWDGVWDLEDL